MSEDRRAPPAPRDVVLGHEQVAELRAYRHRTRLLTVVRRRLLRQLDLLNLQLEHTRDEYFDTLVDATDVDADARLELDTARLHEGVVILTIHHRPDERDGCGCPDCLASRARAAARGEGEEADYEEEDGGERDDAALDALGAAVAEKDDEDGPPPVLH